ncbi:unnamed protein product [Adineta ricciae]|uniref:Uncharacterized protein n=1 Tax=Adineta ricciae TaxID=249248 RepID=A0A816EAS3_ADIRI|nr:unnamed protein product [Adineta ricciae]CAF1647944.1 unnamed protein product [Adineta ricciae]
MDLHGDLTDDILRALRQHSGGLSFTHTLDEEDHDENSSEIDSDFPLSIFADMDVEHLFTNDDHVINSPLNYHTCPTTPASPLRKDGSHSLTDLSTTNQPSLNRHHSMTTEH